MKNIFRRKRNFKNAIFVFLIAFSAFLAFEPLFASLKQNAAQEFASAIFGTIFAAVITMVLLSKQTETEEEKSRNEKVFEEKLTLYNLAIDTLQNIFKKADDDNQVEMKRSDLVDLEFILAKLIMIADEKTIHEFRMIYQGITRNYSPDTRLLRLTSADKHTIFRFSDYCREELGLWDKNIEAEILEDIVLDGELFYHLQEEEHFSPDILSILKDIYGFLVFDLAIPLQQVTFRADGFEVFCDDNESNPFVKCKITEEGLYVTLKDTSRKLKHFKYDHANTLHFGEKDRTKFLEDFASLKKALILSKEG